MVVHLRGWRYGVFIGSFVGSIGLVCYAIILRPMMDPEPYKKMREVAEAEMAQRSRS